jgi:hypothetical protein
LRRFIPFQIPPLLCSGVVHFSGLNYKRTLSIRKSFVNVLRQVFISFLGFDLAGIPDFFWGLEAIQGNSWTLFKSGAILEKT